MQISEAVRKIRILQRSSSGRVTLLALGNKQIKGEQFREMIGLTSTCFTWEVLPTRIHFVAIGYGHGVGMCQYGADGMAKQGWDYHQILCHYYRGVQFRKIKY